MLCGSLSSSAAFSQEDIKELQLGEAVERHLPPDDPLKAWAQDPELLKNELGDRLEVREVAAEGVEIVKLSNVIPPIRFESGVADIPQRYVDELRKVLESVRHRQNVRLHLVGHADDQRLSPTLARRYGDNAGLSRERAGEVAEFLQRALDLAAESISYEWAGDTKPIASNATAAGRARNRRVEVEVWYDEKKEGTAQQEVLVKEDFKRIKVCRNQTVCKLRFMEGHSRRARIKNLVPPLHFDDDTTGVAPEFVEHIRQALDNLHNKSNVTVKFIGYTDDAALTDRNVRIYGNHLALSKARAHRVALALQEALKLPTPAIASDGRGSTLPLASNDTAQGRALNRRIEVEFWHDDPLQELPDDLQLCPEVGGTELVTKVYHPPWGGIVPLQLENGRAVIPAGYTDTLRRALADIAGKTNARLRFIGYARNERLDRRTASVYGDDIGLSAARARRAMQAIQEQLHLTDAQAEHEGRGFVQSDDVVNAGFIQGDTSFVAVHAVYDEPAILDDYEGVDITRMVRELSPQNPYSLNLMRITVDGKPIDDPGRSSADVQRCTDVALQQANIQFQFDNLKSAPRLSVAAAPNSIVFEHLGDELSTEPVQFRMYANYGAFLDRAEVRLFTAGQSLQSTPLEILSIDQEGFAEWQPVAKQFEPSSRELQYVLRVYDKTGNFDETRPQPLWLSYNVSPVAPQGTPDNIIEESVGADINAEVDNAEDGDAVAAPDESTDTPAEHAIQVADTDIVPKIEPGAEVAAEAAVEPTAETELAAKADAISEEQAEAEDPQVLARRAEQRKDARLLAQYGENDLAIKNIRLGSGTVKVHGSGIPANHSVWIAGRRVPVDHNGNFIAEEILPTGMHTVEVAVLDEGGNGELYLRDLEFKRNDTFYVGIADLTFAESRARGPADLLQGENAPYPYDSSFDGRLAFYADKKFGDHWRITASADTREGPVEELFSNFLNKSPESLFRRIDPDNHFPTFGDDSTVEEMAATMGKFYVKLSQNQNHALWGNFKVGYLGNELAHVDRGLYGANAHYQSDATTSFGEQRYTVDGFVAEPGTLPSREEFRGTGGSLYFLRNQDLLVGSERVRIELRDKDSGIVNGVVNLKPVLDYDIDYLQGRILLSEPLNSTVDDQLLIRTGGLSGNEAYLVVRYEYTPGFESLEALSGGGSGHYWINDFIKLGLTTNSNEEGDTDSSLNAADLTLRKSSDTWLKFQTGASEGLLSNAFYSDDGGFDFYSDNPLTFAGASANAYRADLAVGFGDFFQRGKGRVTFYAQSLDAGYSAPGLMTLKNTESFGATFKMPITDRLHVNAKADSRVQEQGLKTTAQEIDANYRLTDRWNVSTGVRQDLREDRSPIIPLTQEQGERTDAVVQVAYESLKKWRAYAFAQDTLSASGDRDENGQIGSGGSYSITERLRLDMEVSNGELGAGGRFGTNYLYSDRTNLYLNYALENERTDNGYGLRGGRRGNLVSGIKQRLSDSSSVYLEERYQATDLSTGLTHATGVSLAPNERWNLGATSDFGTLKDRQTGAETKRTAGGVRIGYGFKSVQFSNGVEYRMDETEQLDASTAQRTTWLFRNSAKYQLTPDWRIVGKLNHALSDSSLGQFYDGGYTEAVIGYGYRPVKHDRLNALAKLTYFYNIPTTDQLTLQNTPAEFIQKSHIAALDITYDLTGRWSIGGKYAFRKGLVSLDRENPEFFANDAHLYVARSDWQFLPNWESTVEARMLELPAFNEQRAGALLAIYRHLGKHAKLGAGYNFTDFSEDLTDLSFTHQGLFINVIGTM